MMNSIVNDRIETLKQKPFSELSLLDNYQCVKSKEEGANVTIGIWKDEVGEGELRIVVQCYRHWILGIGRMSAAGFLIDSHGHAVDLKKEDIYDFF